MQPRLERRMRILSEKRLGAFDTDQYYLERAQRARITRKARYLLRRLQPVVLVTPRWSQPTRFLDDLAIDLAIGKPALRCRSLSLAPIHGRTTQDGWTYLVRAIMEFCDLSIDGPAGQAVDRHGFRHVMTSLLRRTIHGERSALLVHGVEHLDVEALEDFVKVFQTHMVEAGATRKLTVLLAGAVEGPRFDIEGAERLVLPDFGREEAIESLVEFVGPLDRGRLRTAIDLVGGVPALIERLGEAAERDGLGGAPSDHWRALGGLADELRGALAILSSDEHLAHRVEAIARLGEVPYHEDLDPKLVAAGVLRVLPGSKPKVSLRAPALQQLVNG